MNAYHYDYPSLRAHFAEGPRKGDDRWQDDLPPSALQELWNVMQDDLRRSGLKAMAGRIIESRFPAWKQRNMIAHSLKLDRLARTRTLSIDEQAAYDRYEAAWAWVEEVRQASDLLEADPAKTAADLAAQFNFNP